MPGSSSDAMAQSRPPWSIALMMISLAKTSSFCWTSPCTFSLSVGAEDVGEAGAAHLVGDHLRGEREVVQDARQLARRFGVESLLLDDEALDRDDRCCRVFDHAASPRRGRLHVVGHARGVRARVDLVRDSAIAAPQRLPQIPKRERPVGLKLVQRAGFRARAIPADARLGCASQMVRQRVIADTDAPAETPSADAQRQPAAAPARRSPARDSARAGGRQRRSGVRLRLARPDGARRQFPCISRGVDGQPVCRPCARRWSRAGRCARLAPRATPDAP